MLYVETAPTSGVLQAGRSGRSPALFPDCRGLTAVEFALLTPALLLTATGLIDFGRAMLVNASLKHVAAESARFAAIRGAEATSPATETDIVDYAKGRAVGVPSDDVTVTVTWTPNNSSGSSVTIDLTYPFALLSVGFLPVAPLQLSHSSTMVIS